MPFRPGRAVASQLLRFLGNPQVAQLDFGETVIPTFNLGDSLPGLFPTPIREVWAGSSTHTAVVGQTAQAGVWAAPATFSSEDPRNAAGIWILEWAISHAANAMADPAAIEMGIENTQGADPGPGADPGTITPLGGQDIATQTTFMDRANQRAPRSQWNSRTQAAFPLGTTAFWPGGEFNRGVTRSPGAGRFPFYVAPGQTFRIVPGVGNTNQAFNIGIMWVEAEEKPVQQDPPTPT